MTYEYVCTSCGHAWEAEQPISAPALKECPNCKNATAKRQVSGGAGFILRGGGWYADGYGSAKKEASKESSSKESSSKESGAGSTSTASAKKPDSGSGSSSSGGSQPASGSSDGGGAKTAAAGA